MSGGRVEKREERIYHREKCHDILKIISLLTTLKVNFKAQIPKEVFQVHNCDHIVQEPILILAGHCLLF